MKSSRAMYKSTEDYSWHKTKRLRREAYLQSALQEFVKTRQELADFWEAEAAIREMVRLLLDAYEELRKYIAGQVHHERDDFAYYDHHKIIAGTQLAILSTLPLRTGKTAGMSRAEVFADCRKYLDVIELNADLAIFVSLDILWNWFGLAAAGFRKRPTLVRSCGEQLVNYCGKREAGAPKYTFPFFWCSMLWYGIEEILRLDKK